MIHIKSEFSTTDDYSGTSENLVLAYFNKDLGSRTQLDQESNLNDLKRIICSFLNQIGGRIYVGIDPESGKVVGVPTSNVDKTITEIHNHCARISPNPMMISPKVKVIYLPIKDKDQKLTGNYIIKIFVEKGEGSVIYSTDKDKECYYYRSKEGKNSPYNDQEYDNEYKLRVKGEYHPQLYNFDDNSQDSIRRDAEEEINRKQEFHVNMAISAFESSTLEYKNFKNIGDDNTSNASINKKTIAKTICAFLNTSGGRIYMGINDERRIKGIIPSEADKMKDNIEESLKQIFPPPPPGEKLVDVVEVDVLGIKGSALKVLKIKVRPGKIDTIYSLRIGKYGAYYRNGPSCQPYTMPHYQKELKLRLGNAFPRASVKFADDAEDMGESNTPEHLRKFVEYSMNNLEFKYAEKWGRAYPFEGFSFSKQTKGDLAINLGIQHAKSGIQHAKSGLQNTESGLETEIDLGLQFLDYGLTFCSESKKLEAILVILVIINLYASRNQSEKVKSYHEKVESYYEEGLKLFRKQIQIFTKKPEASEEESKELSNLSKIIAASSSKSNEISQFNASIANCLSDLQCTSSAVKPKEYRNFQNDPPNKTKPAAPELPIEKKKTEILESVKKFAVTIVCGGTGSGKSTMLPQYLREIYPKGKIALCQPYKESLDSLLNRIKETLPDKKIYKISHFKHLGGNKDFENEEDGIFVMTHTTMLFQLLYDPHFEQYKCIIIDEPHERLIDTDVLISFMLLALNENNPNTPKFILSSATLDADHILGVLGKMCKIVKIGQSETYNITDHYDIVSYGTDKYDDNSDPEQSVRLIKDILDANYTKFNGHVLIFAANADHVRNIREFVEAHHEIPKKFHVLCVLGNGNSRSYGREIFEEYGQKYKLIISTKVTQTAITIRDLAVVIDCGWNSIWRFNRYTGVSEHTWMKISRSTATQRRGRLGRTCNGDFYPLYSEQDQKNMAEFEKSSMDTYSCSGMILLILRHKRNAFTLKMINKVLNSRNTDEIKILVELFKKMNYQLDKPGNKILDHVLEELFKRINYQLRKPGKNIIGQSVPVFVKENRLTLDDNGEIFNSSVVKAANSLGLDSLKSKEIQKTFSNYYKTVCYDLRNYKLFKLNFLDNEIYLRNEFTAQFMSELSHADDTGKKLRNSRTLILKSFLMRMNPCLRCQTSIVDPMVATKACLSCSNIKFSSREHLEAFAKQHHLTLNYNKSFLRKALDEILHQNFRNRNYLKLRREFEKVIKITLKKFKKKKNVTVQESGSISMSSMPSVTKICWTEDILHLYYYGMIRGVTNSEKLKGWDELTIDQKVDLFNNITLTELGNFTSELDKTIEPATALIKSIELGCETNLIKSLAVQSNDWFLFKIKESDVSDNNRLSRQAVIRQWRDPNDKDKLEGEMELYAKIYDSVLKGITEVQQELDIDGSSPPFENLDFMDSLKEWGKKWHLEASSFEDVQFMHAFWKEVADKAKERIRIEVKEDKEFGLKKSLFYGNWKNIVFGNFLKGKSANEDKIVYSMAQLHDREEIRYNFDLKSVLQDYGNDSLKDRYFVCIRPEERYSRFAKDPDKIYPLNIEAKCSSILINKKWINEVPEPLQSHVLAIGKKPRAHTENEYELFDKSLHEDLAIYIKAKGKADHFYKRPKFLRSMLAKTGFFKLENLETIKSNNHDLLYIKFSEDYRPEYEKAKGKSVMIDGKWCSTGLWNRGRFKQQIRIESGYAKNPVWKKYILEKFKDYDTQLKQPSTYFDYRENKEYIILEMETDEDALDAVRGKKPREVDGLVTHHFKNKTHEFYKEIYKKIYKKKHDQSKSNQSSDYSKAKNNTQNSQQKADDGDRIYVKEEPEQSEMPVRNKSGAYKKFRTSVYYTIIHCKSCGSDDHKTDQCWDK